MKYIGVPSCSREAACQKQEFFPITGAMNSGTITTLIAPATSAVSARAARLPPNWYGGSLSSGHRCGLRCAFL